MPVLKTLVEPTAKARFQAMAKERHLSESELLRAVILAITDDNEPAMGRTVPEPDNAEITRMTVRMPRFLVDSVGERAQAKGMASSRWVAALVQSHLTALPVMTADELNCLRTSNRELAAIGRHLHRIAQSSNDAFQQGDLVRLNQLGDFANAVLQNRITIQRLVRASQHAWGGPDGPD
jgi:methyl-accepting chemotaxis protein